MLNYVLYNIMCLFFSLGSMQMERSNVSMTMSKISVNIDGGEPLDNIPDDLSECNLETEFGLSLQFQMASMLTFAYIWSLGAFCPFKYVSCFYIYVCIQSIKMPVSIVLQ